MTKTECYNLFLFCSLQVLGTPTREQIREMNPNYTEFKFPQIKAHPWTKVSQQVQEPFYYSQLHHSVTIFTCLCWQNMLFHSLLRRATSATGDWGKETIKLETCKDGLTSWFVLFFPALVLNIIFRIFCIHDAFVKHKVWVFLGGGLVLNGKQI